MQISPHAAGDEQRLEELIRTEDRANTRDRLRMALLALRGMEAKPIAAMLSSSRRTVQAWVYRYREGGIEALLEQRYKGRTPHLNAEQCERFKARMLAGAQEHDGVCTLRGKDAVAIIAQEFGVKYSLNGAYKLLHRVGLSCLAPRPRHEKQDLAAQEKFKDQSAPFFSAR